jgi:hypothetical protein
MADAAQDAFSQALASGRRPAVFMFQPNKFEIVMPDRLAEWEYSITQYFGLPSPQFDEYQLAGASWSNCGEGLICADDSDYHDFGGERVDPSDASDRLAEAVAEGRKPTVFMWQPSRFELVAEDKLADWERNIREHVGIPASQIRRDEGGSATLSVTLPNECMDDSDYLAE